MRVPDDEVPESFLDQLLDQAKPQGHLFQFYQQNHRALTANVAEYLTTGIKRGFGLLVIASQDHCDAFIQQLTERGVETDGPMQTGQFVCLDVTKALSGFILDSRPDWERFDSTLGKMVRDIRARVNARNVRIYSEMVGSLWNVGQLSAAIQVEEFWKRLSNMVPFQLFCGYPMSAFGRDTGSPVEALLSAHTHLRDTGENEALESAISRAMSDILGPGIDDRQILARERQKTAGILLPRAETLILFLRTNFPDRAEEVLARSRQYYESEKRFRALIENSSDIISLLDAQGRILYASASTLKILGYHPHELVGTNALSWIHPDDHMHVTRLFGELLTKPRVPMDIQVRVRRKDGGWRWIESKSSNLLEEPHIHAIVANYRDITERKSAEEATLRTKDELRALAASLFTAQEEERRRVARELHDDLSQTVALLEIETERIEQRLPETSEMRSDLRSLRERTASLSDGLRRIAHQLHPSTLDDLGLPAALRALADDLSRHHRLPIRVECEDVPAGLPPTVAGCLYRVAQEAIRNAVKHAAPTKVTIRLARAGTGLDLWVEDNGVGFDTQAAHRNRGLGLISMEERARLAAGYYSLQSQAGEGTRVRVWVPLETANESEK